MNSLTAITKTLLGLALLGILVGGSFYLGKNLMTPSVNPEDVSTTATPTIPSTPTPTLTPIFSPSIAVSPTASPSASRTVAGGLPKSSGLVFGGYTLTVPNDWTVERKTDSGVPTDQLKLTKNSYELTIYQAATGGAVCLYPGDPAFNGPSSTYDSFVAITTTDATSLRRSGTNANGPGVTKTFTLCQKGPENTYQIPSSYGHMTYSVPLVPNDTILKEMDTIVGTLKKIN